MVDELWVVGVEQGCRVGAGIAPAIVASTESLVKLSSMHESCTCQCGVTASFGGGVADPGTIGGPIAYLSTD
jgi:hypothetical protein